VLLAIPWGAPETMNAQILELSPKIRTRVWGGWRSFGVGQEAEPKNDRIRAMEKSRGSTRIPHGPNPAVEELEMSDGRVRGPEKKPKETHGSLAQPRRRGEPPMRLSVENLERPNSEGVSCTLKKRQPQGYEHIRLRCMVLALLSMVFSSVPGDARAQNMDKTVLTVDDEVTAFAYAPDGRIVFAVRKMYKAKKYDLERDDIYVLEQNGKRKKIFSGEKFMLGDKPFTYLIEGFTWSPNGKIVAVQMYTTTVDIEDGTTADARGLLFLDDQGRMLKPGRDPVVLDAQNPLWLRDSSTVVYMTATDLPMGVYSLQYLNVFSGPAGKAFEGRTFLEAARISGSNSAMAVERDRNMDGPPRIQKLELLSQEAQEVATLEAFSGGLSLSPSGTKAAYYLDKEVLEIRDLTAPSKLARMRVGLGVLQWSEDETKIYLKRTVEKKSADLVSVDVPVLKAYANRAEIPIDEPTPSFLLHGLTIREFGISPDGRYLGIVLPGKRNLEVFSMK
jgi:hypothetical protein